MSIIKLSNLNKFIGNGRNRINILKNIDIEINSGEMVAIVGPSGSGKSTLLSIIGCIDKPSSGTYFLKEREINFKKSNDLSIIRNSEISFIHQNYALIPNYSVKENLMLPLLYRKKLTKLNMSNGEILDKCIEVLIPLNIDKLLNTKANKLSGGEQQRVAIARSILSSTDIILADEPTGALDSKNGEIILNILKELNKNGKTIIIVTHDEEVSKKCDRIISLKDGEIGEL